MNLCVITPTLPEREETFLPLCKASVDAAGVPHLVGTDIHKKGIGHTLNVLALEAYRDGFTHVLVVGDDDTIDSSYPQNMIEVMEENRWVTSSYKRTDGLFVDIRSGVKTEIKEQNLLSAFILIDIELLFAIGGYSTLAVFEDWELSARLLTLGYSYSVNHKGGYNYTIHDTQISKADNGWHQNTLNLISLYKKRD
jgi:hypothetical protein